VLKCGPVVSACVCGGGACALCVAAICVDPECVQVLLPNKLTQPTKVGFILNYSFNFLLFIVVTERFSILIWSCGVG